MKNRRRPDPVTNIDHMGSLSMEGICHALKPLDRVANDMEKKWGNGTQTCPILGGKQASKH